MKTKIDIEKLRWFCLAGIDEFNQFGDVQDTPDGTLVYIDRKSSILGIAHRDTQLPKFDVFRSARGKNGNDYVLTPRLDDRLGVYLLVDFLKNSGLSFDVLLTDGEETGRSTARYFEKPKEYNWIFSFDRRGTDVVMYQYETKENIELLKQHGFVVGDGSFSDIAVLDDLGVAGFNFGCGYQNEHTAKCFVNLNDTRHMAGKFVNFFHRMKNTKIPYTKPKRAQWKRYPYYEDEVCKVCGIDAWAIQFSFNWRFGICFECEKRILDIYLDTKPAQSKATLFYCGFCDDWVTDNEFHFTLDMCYRCASLRNTGGL